ncbi:hypothetical protein L3Q82_021157 [Scortum barcoo]|uniref:Uncharacterized protein n=1 Tax=Scortum barcoo TaxID=214431 RepID=A0ACB8X3G6_9TELE|nr:hypothetical protein L3Q82_021157 [Scortum barcoo]
MHYLELLWMDPTINLQLVLLYCAPRGTPLTLLNIFSGVHESTGVTPAELNLSRPLKGPLDAELSPRLCDPDTPAYVTADRIAEFKKMVSGNLMKAKQRQKHNYDKGRRDEKFSEMDRVWIRTHPYSKADKSFSAKLAPRWKGPYRVTRKVGPLNFEVVLEDTGEDLRVVNVGQRQKIRKAPGPDAVSPSCLKVCTDQLTPIVTQIFNRSLELCEVPSCFKCSTILPIPKKPSITGLNDYRPIALTSVVMKSFKRLVLAHLKDITGPLLWIDPCSLPTGQTDQWMMQSTWDCTTSCNTSTPQGLMQGSCSSFRNEEVQPASGAADPVLHCHHSVCPQHIHHCVVWISHQTGQEQTTTDSQDCRENHWCQPALHSGLVCVSRVRKRAAANGQSMPHFIEVTFGLAAEGADPKELVVPMLVMKGGSLSQPILGFNVIERILKTKATEQLDSTVKK